MRSFGKNEKYEGQPVNQQGPVLAVTPLNSVPYVGPPKPLSNTAFSSETSAAKGIGPALIFWPSLQTPQELVDVLCQTQNAVGLSGSAATGFGPLVGAMNLAESDDEYHFLVSLPGVPKDENFSCTVGPDGTVLIKGITTTGERTVCRYSQVFVMQSTNLPPPGHFSVSFCLEGLINHEEFEFKFEDGILEGFVKKRVIKLET